MGVGRAVRTLVGVITGAAVALAIGLGVADGIAEADGTSVAWAKGLVALYLIGPVAVLAGGIAGGLLARGSAKRTVQPAWAEPPAGTLGGHYLAAWLGGIAAGIASGVVVMPVAFLVLGIFSIYLGMLFPLLMKLTGLLVAVAVIASMVAVGRAVTRLLDRWIHRARTGTAAHRAAPAPGS